MNNTPKILSLQYPIFNNDHDDIAKNLPQINSKINPHFKQTIAFVDAPFGADKIPDFSEKIPFIDDQKLGGKSSGAYVLGSITKSQSVTKNQNLTPEQKHQKKRSHLYKLKSIAEKIIFENSRLCACCNSRVDASQNVKLRLKTNTKHKSTGVQKTTKATFTNVFQCANLWICPICHAKIMAFRGKEIAKAKAKYLKNGGHVSMFTFTHSHDVNDKLKTQLDQTNVAFSRFFGDREMKNFFEIIQKDGHIKNLETTWSRWNSWHPHNHMIIFCALSKQDFFKETIEVFGPPKAENDDSCYKIVTEKRRHSEILRIENRLKKSKEYTDSECKKLAIAEFEKKIILITPFDFVSRYWIKVAVFAGLGRPSLEHGLTISDGGDIDEYLTKMKLGLEMTDTLDKSGKNSSENQWQILAKADTNPQYAMLFREYAEAFKGQRQLVWSRGLREKLNLIELTDNEILALDEEISPDEIENIDELEIEYVYWQRIKYWKLHAQILELAEEKGLDYVKNYLPTIKSLPESYSEKIVKPPHERKFSINQMLNQMLNEPILKPALAPCELEKVS